MRLFEGPTITESYVTIEDVKGWIAPSLDLPDDIDEQIANYDLHHPILAHHKTCKCYRCVE